VHYVKLDGFRMMVWRDAAGVRLLTRNGIDWTARYPLIAAAAGALRTRSFLLDGEAVACDGNGVPVFERLRYRRQDGRVFLYAFDLIEIEGMDLRSSPLECARRRWPSCCGRPGQGWRSTTTSTCPPTSSSATPANSAWRASSASAWARAIAQGERTTAPRPLRRAWEDLALPTRRIGHGVGNVHHILGPNCAVDTSLPANIPTPRGRKKGLCGIEWARHHRANGIIRRSWRFAAAWGGERQRARELSVTASAASSQFLVTVGRQRIGWARLRPGQRAAAMQHSMAERRGWHRTPSPAAHASALALAAGGRRRRAVLWRGEPDH
jgi:hypothetical protein